MAVFSSPARSARLVAATSAVAAATSHGESASSSAPIHPVGVIPSKTLALPGSPSSTAMLVLLRSPSSMETTVLHASVPGFPSSPTTVLRVLPLTAIIPVSSPDLSTPSIKNIAMSSNEPAPYVHDESLYAHKPAMVWQPNMSEFVLNCLVELVKSGVCFNQGFKESQMKKVANDVLNFTGNAVSTLQIYNHIRKWRNRWSLISRLKSEGKLKWSEVGTCFMLEDEDNLHDHLKNNPKHLEFLNSPIVNYAHMKTIFTPRFVTKEQLYQPHLLIKALNFIADNKDECAEYHGLQAWERRTWLRTWLRKQFA